jgi:uncharacterized protein
MWPERCGRATLVASRPAPIPKLTGRLMDQANLLPATVEHRLIVQLARFEARTKHQFVIVTVPSLDGEAIENFGLRLGNGWGIGRHGYDDGVLLIVVPNERKVRIEVGCGLEKTLTDQISALIIARDMTPAFQKGNFTSGIERGAAAIMAQLSR